MSSELKDNLKGTIKSYVSGILRAIIVGLLVLVQFGLIIVLSIFLTNYTVYIYWIIEFLSIIIMIGLVNDNRSMSYKLSWICIVLVLPLTGHIMYLLWGKSTSKRKLERNVLAKFRRAEKKLDYNEEVMKELETEHPVKARMAKYMESQNFPLSKNNEIKYFEMGEDVFEDMFRQIFHAKRFILINFFIVAEGALWDKMHEVLLEKIAEGVKIMFLYDDFGAVLRTPKNFKRSLEQEGFLVGVFNPIHKYTEKLYMNYRSHQKIVVIDGRVGYTGGINLADEYVNIVNRFGVWKDNAVRVEGDVVWALTVTFLKMWEVANENDSIDYDEFRGEAHQIKSNVYCQVLSDGPANNPNNPIETVYRQMINYAQDYLYVTTPYLIIEDDMIQALTTAASSGVDVRILTPYIPDKKNVKTLTNYNYGRLLEGGVKIYEYVPGFIHAKTIINEDCAIVGTINMDYRSFYLHYECGVWVCNKDAIRPIKEDILETIKQCKEITYAMWQNRPLHIKIYQAVLNLIATLL